MPTNESPTEFCDKQTLTYSQNSVAETRKQKGQFFTRPEIAKFMARIGYHRSDELNVLDPGAGSGMLSCALCELIGTDEQIDYVRIDTYENDPALIPYLQNSLEYAKNWLFERGTQMLYSIQEQDFLLAKHNLRTNRITQYDLAISNPPYFKIAGNDPRALAAKEFVYGQPNIYYLFMAHAAKILTDSGVIVFVTPRSYTAGKYFEAFRKSFLKIMAPERIHLFESRTDAFSQDLVLQESVILKARKTRKKKKVSISHSVGVADLEQSSCYEAPYDVVVAQNGHQSTIRIPVSSSEEEILRAVDRWDFNLPKLGLKVSTGPVVPFRATDLLVYDEHTDDDIVPLLWMHNVKPMTVKWPNNHNGNSHKKPAYIRSNVISRRKRLLVRNRTIVILRRFSSKEQQRRLIAAPLFKDQLGSTDVGLENHLNYIYPLQGSLTQIEALGLSALLNSSLLDQYFRISNGNTEVSSTELRAMPLPPREVWQQIGGSIEGDKGDLALETLDRIVTSVIGHANLC